MDTLAPALAIVFEILTVLARFMLGFAAAIAVAYFAYLFTYYKKHLEKGIGVSVQIKAKRAGVIFGVVLVLLIAAAAVVCPMLQAMYAARVV